jgi:hypothetical protein
VLPSGTQTALYCQGAPLSGAAYDWTGRPTNKNRLLTPIFYHRGSWLSLQGIDPTTTGTPNSFYWPLVNGSANAVQMQNTQYGTAFESASSLLPKAPTTVLFNMFLGATPTTTGSGLAVPSNYNTYATASFATIGNATKLLARHAFVALIDPCDWMQRGNPGFLCLPFPGTGTTTITQTVNGTNYTNKTKVADETLIAGGNLLVLTGLYPNGSGGFSSGGCSYFNVAALNDGTVIQDDLLTSLIASDQDVLARCYPKFRKFAHYVYVFGTQNNKQSTAVANGCWSHLQTIGANAAAYGVTVRGLYQTGVTNIASIVTADVTTFLNSL